MSWDPGDVPIGNTAAVASLTTPGYVESGMPPPMMRATIPPSESSMPPKNPWRPSCQGRLPSGTSRDSLVPGR